MKAQNRWFLSRCAMRTKTIEGSMNHYEYYLVGYHLTRIVYEKKYVVPFRGTTANITKKILHVYINAPCATGFQQKPRYDLI